jgi:hypothetical protein
MKNYNPPAACIAPPQGPHLLVKMKFKDFSRTFKDLFQYIQGPGNWKNL